MTLPASRPQWLPYSRSPGTPYRPGGDRGPFAAATELPLDHCPGRDGLGPSRSPSAEVPLPNWSPAIEGLPRRQGPVWWSDSQNPATELSVPTGFEAVLSRCPCSGGPDNEQVPAGHGSAGDGERERQGDAARGRGEPPDDEEPPYDDRLQSDQARRPVRLQCRPGDRPPSATLAVDRPTRVATVSPTPYRSTAATQSSPTRSDNQPTGPSSLIRVVGVGPVIPVAFGSPWRRCSSRR